MKSTEVKDKTQLKLVEDSFASLQQIVQSQMKCAALKMVKSLFDDEVERLCGKSYSRKLEGLAHRAGSDPSSILLNGQRVKVKKPRVKQDGEEVFLQTHSALNDYDLLCERAMAFMLSGVSTRDYEPLLDEVSSGMGLKKSSVSKAFKKGSKQALEELNGRDLKTLNLFSLMFDGIHLGKRCVVVALGIDTKGRKHVIGLREGNTENMEVCKDLLESLVERGLDTNTEYLFVIDGSKPLRSAINKIFGTKHSVQRCTQHKLRNITNYLPKNYHAELRRRWKKLHGLVTYKEAEKEYKILLSWLEKINLQAASSLEEASLETLTLIKLQCPGSLRKSLHTTNVIESIFDRVKGRSARVKNWKGNDQVSRWAASLLLEAEKKCIAVPGCKQIPVLLDNLKKFSLANKQEIA